MSPSRWGFPAARCGYTSTYHTYMSLTWRACAPFCRRRPPRGPQVKPAQPYRVLLLDLDGTIVDYARTEEAALAAVHAEFFRRHVSYPEFRRAFHACNDELWAAYRRHQVDLDILRAERFLRLRAAVGASVAIDVITTRFEAELGRAVVLFRDARPALRALRRAFRLILVTDGIAAVQRAKLATS